MNRIISDALSTFPFPRYNEIHDKKKWGKVQSACQSKTWSKQRRLFLLSYYLFPLQFDRCLLKFWVSYVWGGELKTVGLVLLWVQWVWVRTLKTLWFQCVSWAHPWCSDVRACAHPWCSDLNACMWAHPDACISMRVCEHTHDTLILMCEHTHDADLNVYVWAHPWCLRSPVCVCVSTSALWSQQLWRELQMMLTDWLLILLPTK